MTYDELISYFGTQQRIAAALGITQPTVSAWGRTVPDRYQYQLEVITDGALRASEELRRPVANDARAAVPESIGPSA